MFHSQVSWEHKEWINRRLQTLQKNETFCSGSRNPNLRTKARKRVQSFLPGMMQKLSPQKPGPTPAVPRCGRTVSPRRLDAGRAGQEKLQPPSPGARRQVCGHHFMGKVSRSASKTLGTLSPERGPGTAAMAIPFQFTTSGQELRPWRQGTTNCLRVLSCTRPFFPATNGHGRLGFKAQVPVSPRCP